MSNEIKILDSILNRELRPWLPQHSLDDVFATKFRNTKEYVPEQALQYQIHFHRPFNYKTKYYSKLILNTVSSEFDKLHSLFNEDKNESLILYWLNDTLNKRLKTYLKDIGNLIKEKDFDTSYINPKNTNYQIDAAHKTNTFIMQLLKLAFMQLYLEIQEAFNDLIIDELIVEDFYSQLLNEPIPTQPPITKTQVFEVEPQPIKKKKANKVNDIQFHSFTYKQYNSNPDKIQNVWDSLKYNNFICQETPLATFRKIFSGTEINTPVKWTGNISDLYYFVKCIHNDFKLVENLKQKQWEVTCICFVDNDGESFDRSRFRLLKKPNSTAKKLDKAVNHLI